MNVHPLLIHFPIALLTVYVVMECLRFKKLLAEHSWFYSNLLKIDTDGHDLKAILGASEYIKREVPYLLFEYDLTMKPANLEDTDKVLDLLSSAGYGKILFIPT